MNTAQRLAAEQHLRLACDMERDVVCLKELYTEEPMESAYHSRFMARLGSIHYSSRALQRLYRERLDTGCVDAAANEHGESKEQELLRHCRFQGRAPPGTGKDIGQVEVLSKTETVYDAECTPVQYYLHESVLSKATCEKIIRFIDEATRRVNHEDAKVDLVLGGFYELLTDEEASKLDILRVKHGFHQCRAKARKWRASKDLQKGIDLHKDHHERVMQIALNVDFTGGKLYYKDRRKHFFERKVGMGIVHDNTVWHGVTPLEAGTRYSVYLLV